jgi:ribosome modulation factor
VRDDRDIDDRADEARDSWRQRLDDAHMEGCEAGRKGLSAEMNPYYAFEPEHNEWHHGRLEGLAQQSQRKVA